MNEEISTFGKRNDNVVLIETTRKEQKEIFKDPIEMCIILYWAIQVGKEIKALKEGNYNSYRNDKLGEVIAIRKLNDNEVEVETTNHFFSAKII